MFFSELHKCDFFLYIYTWIYPGAQIFVWGERTESKVESNFLKMELKNNKYTPFSSTVSWFQAVSKSQSVSVAKKIQSLKK